MDDEPPRQRHFQRWLKPMQPGCLHRDNIWSYLPAYLRVATRNRFQQKRTKPGGPAGRTRAGSLAACREGTPTFWRQQLPPGTLGLTFDDGPHPVGTPAVLDVLARHHARAVFFALGAAITAHVELAVQIHMAGHALGYHGWKHRPERSGQGFEGFDRTARLLESKAEQPVLLPLIRYPHGFNQFWFPTQHDRCVISNVGWTLDSLDYSALPQRRKLKRLLRILSRSAAQGHVILMHDGGRGGESTAELLDRFLDRAASMGWQTISLTEHFQNSR